MAEDQVCSKCGSSKLMKEIKLTGNLGEELLVQAFKKPSAKVFKGMVQVPLKATVCGECGYAEFYVAEPEKLYNAYQKGSTLEVAGKLSLSDEAP